LGEYPSNEEFTKIFQNEYYEKRHSDTEKARRARYALVLDIIGIAVVIVCAIVLSKFYSLNIVNEQSMDNTIIPRDCIMIAKTEYSFSNVEYGDIIAYTTTIADGKGGTKNLVSRVIGRPGDTIQIKNGVVLRNGRRLIENYIKEGRTDGEIPSVTIPDGSYFVMGDNRQDSIDSRDARISFVTDGQIIGKVIYRPLPISRAGTLYGN